MCFVPLGSPGILKSDVIAEGDLRGPARQRSLGNPRPHSREKEQTLGLAGASEARRSLGQEGRAEDWRISPVGCRCSPGGQAVAGRHLCRRQQAGAVLDPGTSFMCIAPLRDVTRIFLLLVLMNSYRTCFLCVP